LHFHSPSSYDYKNKSVSNQRIIDNLVDNEISLVSITDHHFIDIRIITDMIELGKAKNITVLPGIELRTDKGGSESVHIIGIFSDDGSISLETIWTKLSGKLGITEEEVNKKGDDKVYVNLEMAADLIHELGGVVSIHAGSKSNSIENITNSLSYKMAIKADILEKIDIFELGQVIDHHDYLENVYPNISHIKEPPMILCSDNHDINNYEVKENLWVKADPTFEGLMHTIYDPFSRVKIQHEKPEEKINYTLIKEVRFKDTSGDKIFQESPIRMNQNLNVIIGGKSSGKSLLLYHIAKAIDPMQVEEKTEPVRMIGYDFEESTDFDFEVEWSDGRIDSLNKYDPEEKNRQITFVPQMYINHLAEERGEEKLKELIETILNHNESYYQYKKRKDEEIEDQKIELSNLVNKLFSLREKAITIKEEIKAIGEEKAIRIQIDEHYKGIEELRKKAGFTEDENKEFLKLSGLKKHYDESEWRYARIHKKTDSFKSFLESWLDDARDEIKNDVFGHLDNTDDDVIEKFIAEKIITEIDSIHSDVQMKTNSELPEIINSLEQKMSMISSFSQSLKVQLNPFYEKVKNKEQLEKIQKELQGEGKKLTSIIEKTKEYDSVKREGLALRNQIMQTYNDLFGLYKDLRDELHKEEYKRIDENLELDVELVFNINKFEESFTDLFDRRSNFENSFGSFYSNNVYEYTEEKHYENIQVIFNKLTSITNLDISLRTGCDDKDAHLMLFDDYFQLKYNIVQNGESILKMSPGKRGLVLLQLFLHLSEAEHPILIDQPEDNLDNRTIFTELNDFIRGKKIKRQIILVTHNANLVVSTDSEHVIVANQEGENHGQENKQYKFEYIEGSLENTFIDSSQKGILNQMGIREHVCEILEGGKEAFENREKKYGFKKLI